MADALSGRFVVPLTLSGADGVVVDSDRLSFRVSLANLPNQGSSNSPATETGVDRPLFLALDVVATVDDGILFVSGVAADTSPVLYLMAFFTLASDDTVAACAIEDARAVLLFLYFFANADPALPTRPTSDRGRHPIDLHDVSTRRNHRRGQFTNMACAC